MNVSKSVNRILKLEEAGQFLLAIFLFSLLDYSWWVFPVCLLLPDISMIGYLGGAKTGARLYNIFHNKFVAILVLITGFWLSISWLALAGIILLGHSAMDRMLGYGLKLDEGFEHTHLGRIGKKGKQAKEA